DDDQGTPSTASHRATMHDHHVERYGQGGLVAVEHHADAVAHEQKIRVSIGNGGHSGVVGGQRDDRDAALSAADVDRGHPGSWCLSRHVSTPPFVHYLATPHGSAKGFLARRLRYTSMER